MDDTNQLCFEGEIEFLGLKDLEEDMDMTNSAILTLLHHLGLLF